MSSIKRTGMGSLIAISMATVIMGFNTGQALADTPPPPAPVIDINLLPPPENVESTEKAEIEWSKSSDFIQKNIESTIEEVKKRISKDISDILAQSPIRPGSYELTSLFAPRWGTHHDGIDMASPLGTKIYAAAAGTVIDAGPASGFGNWIRIQHDDGDITVYGHMASSGVLVKAGQRVKAGDNIGLVGSEGFSTGPHLHFEVWEDGQYRIDPVPWLKTRKVNVG